MATSGDDFVLKVKADLKSLQAGLRQAVKEADIAGKSMKGSLEPAMGRVEKAVERGATAMVGQLRLVGIAAIAAGAAMAGQALKGALDFADGMAKLRDKTRFTVEELQRLQYVGSQVGLSNEELATGLDMFTKSLAKARTEGGDAATAFENLGIAMTDENGPRKAEAVFLDVIRALEQIPDPSRQAAFALEFFGKAGLNVALLASQGAGAFDKLRESAVGIIDGQTIDKADQLGDSLTRLGDAISKGLMKSVLEATPAVSKFLDELTRDPESIQKTIDKVAEFGGAVMSGAKFLVNYVHPAGQVYHMIQAIRGAADDASDAMSGLGNVPFRAGAVGGPGAGAAAPVDPMASMPSLPTDAPQFNVETPEETKQRVETAKKVAEEARRAAQELADAKEYAMKQLEGGLAPGEADRIDADFQRALELGADYGKQVVEQRQGILESMRDAEAVALEDENARYAFRLATLESASEAELAMIGGYNEAKEREAQRHEDAVADIKFKALEAEVDFVEKIKSREAQTIARYAANGLASAATFSKKAFEANKFFHAAQATVAAYDAATAAYAWAASWGGPPAGAAAAGVALAAGFANVKAILSAKFGGGGATGLPGAANPNNSTPAESARGAPSISLTLVGGNFSQDAVRGLVDQINEALADGAGPLRT